MRSGGQLKNLWFGILVFLASVFLFKSALADLPNDVSKDKKEIIIQAISSLLVVDPRNNEGYWRVDPAWEKFTQTLRKAKALGITSITLDIWWGLVQPNNSSDFNWEYYDKVLNIIAAEGLEIDPILSTHQCGTNIGDDVFIPLPEWFRRLIKENGWAYVSEAGNVSDEVASIWARGALPYYSRFWAAFRNRYAHLAHLMPKIIIGLGPAGELTLPSYHFHDRSKDYIHAKVPGRGSLQVFSRLAQESYLDFLKKEYRELKALNERWGTDYVSWSQIGPLGKSANADDFFKNQRHFALEGQDLFTWQHESLLHHAQVMMSEAGNIFGNHQAYKKVALAFKTPGIHWGFNHRLPLLMAGQIESRGANTDINAIERHPKSWLAENGLGYSRLFTEVFGQLKRKHPNVRWEWVFTCAEMRDCPEKCYLKHGDGCKHCRHEGSAAYTLAENLGLLADRNGIPTTIENALESNLLFDKHAWLRMISHWKNIPHIYSLSLLRLPNLVENKVPVEIEKDGKKTTVVLDTVSIEMLRLILEYFPRRVAHPECKGELVIASIPPPNPPQ